MDASVSPARIQFSLRRLLGAVFLVAVLLGVGSYWREKARASAHREDVRVLLKQLGLTLNLYHSMQGSYPPPAINDANGRPRQSWRGLVIHYQEKTTPPFDSNVAWDDPVNRGIGASPIYYYCGRYAEDNAARILAVVGEDCVMQPGKTTSFEPAMENVGIVVDVGPSGIPWSKPGDITLDELLNRFDRRSVGPFPEGFFALFCNGDVRLIPYSTPREEVRAMFTVKGSRKSGE